jgi:phospholipase/carboxylesterase
MTYRLREDNDAVLLTPSAAAPAASVIWMHGLGASGQDFVPIVPQLGLPPALGVRFVFPHAPVRAVTWNQGFRMRAWYDIRQLSAGAVEDAAGIEESAARVAGLIRREADQGIAPDRIVLAGFSQGGAMALHVGIRYPEPLAGILALSTYLPLRDRLAPESSEANRHIPILMCHGRSDSMLTIQVGRHSRDLLMRQGYAVQWQEYDMAHEVCGEEIEDIGQWLRARLSP